MKVETIKQAHARWAASCLPADASQVQRQEMERAFYSGAFTFFTITMAQVAALPDDAAEAAMTKLEEEMKVYFRLLGTIPGPTGTQNQ